MSLTISSPVFANNSLVSPVYTCDGLNISPPLKWVGVPPNSQSLVLIIDDPDAPDPAAPKRVWVHWVLYNLPVHISGLPEDIAPQALPTGTLEGLNDWGETGYGGPCPPIGCHRYFHKLYALDVVLPDLRQPTKETLHRAMEGHVLAHAETIGLYKRPQKPS
jgi:Raf kinase inhibitor-like YbhB/YbcL family protein